MAKYTKCESKKKYFLGSEMCTSQKLVHGLTQDSVDDSSDVELISSVEYVSGFSQYHTQAIHCKMMVEGKPLHFQVDSGASVINLTSVRCPIQTPLNNEAWT